MSYNFSNPGSIRSYHFLPLLLDHSANSDLIKQNTTNPEQLCNAEAPAERLKICALNKLKLATGCWWQRAFGWYLRLYGALLHSGHILAAFQLMWPKHCNAPELRASHPWALHKVSKQAENREVFKKFFWRTSNYFASSYLYPIPLFVLRIHP